MSRAVIVFGASGGLGRQMLSGLASSGYSVYGTAHEATDVLEATLKEAGLDPSRYGLTIDATDFAQVSECVATVAAQDDLWGIINLVGVSWAARLATSASEEIQRVLLANLMPAFWVTKALFELYREQGKSAGRLIHASSVVARRPVPGTIPYAASKCAIEGLVRASAEEAARYGITVNAMRLGYFDAGMSAGVPEKVLAAVTAATARARLGTGSDLLAMTQFLLSDVASFVTGATMELDGGLV